jgi:1,4-alpha-glucan branching enzyme/maltooligosyltrehalose trehalohydrolase
VLSPHGLGVEWRLGDGSMLRLLANLSAASMQAATPAGARVFGLAVQEAGEGALVLGPWAVLWTLAGAGAQR